MANDLTKFSPELWSARVQVLTKRNLVGGAIASTEERSVLSNGTQVHRPYHSRIYAQDYTKGTAITNQDIDTTDEYLTVNQVKVAPLYIDDVDNIQNKYNTYGELTMEAAYAIRNVIDQKVLGEVANAGLNSGTAATVASNNIVSLFSGAKASLFNNGCEEDKPWFTVLDPDTVSSIEQYFGANGFNKQDSTLQNGYGIQGYLGDWLGLKVFKSQNVPYSVDIVFSDDPTADTTLILNGVTFTFKSSIGTTAGAVLIDAGSDVDVTIGTNLVAAINGGTAGTTYYQLSNANRAKLKAAGVTASYVAGTNTLTITAYGKMTIAGTQDTGTVGTQTKKVMVGKMGCIDLVIQSSVKTQLKDVPNMLGKNIFTWALYGVKTFNEGAERMYSLNLNA